MKQYIAIFIGAALVVEALLFFGLGFGLNALSATGTPNTSCTSANGYCWSSTPFWAYTSAPGSGPEVYLGSNVNENGQAINAIGAGQQSTAVTFWVQAESVNGCPRTGAWQGGYEAGWSFSFPQSVTASVTWTGPQNEPVSSNQYTGSSFSVWLNGTGTANQADLTGCAGGNQAPSGGAIDVPNGPTGAMYTMTVVLIGPYPVMQMTVGFYVFGQWCDGSPYGSAKNQCDGLNNALKAAGESGQNPANDGAFSGWATASITWQSAVASFQWVDTSQNFNGGTLTAIFYTSYDGPAGYNFTIEIPTARSNGGQVDHSFSPNPENIPNFCLSGCQKTWSIPADLDTNLSGHTLSWDQWTGVLTTSYVVQQIAQFTVINPLYAPTTPVITYTTSGAGIYPAVGDTVTLTIFSNESKDSGPVNNISVEVYYLGPGSNVQGAPGCGQGWVTYCPNGQILTVTHNGNNAVGTYQFTVNPPIGDTSIGVAALSGSQYSPSLFGYRQINIKPADCPLGGTCDPLQSTQTLWMTLGPILLAAILVTLAAFVVLWAPAGMWYLKFGLPIAVLVLIATLWAVGFWTGMFAGGAIFNPNGVTR